MSESPDFSPEAIAEAGTPDEVRAAPDYEAMAAQVDLSDLAVVRRHVYTANPKEWPKPLLYALLAALEAAEKERGEAIQLARDACGHTERLAEKFVAIEAALEARDGENEAVEGRLQEIGARVRALREWDMLTPGALGDGAWARDQLQAIDAALDAAAAALAPSTPGGDAE